MNREKIIAEINFVLREQLGLDSQTPIFEHSRFIEDLGADSLDIVEIIMGFEENFSKLSDTEVCISDIEATSITTVGEAATIFEKYFN